MSNENNIQSINAKRLTIRISRFHLSFSTSKITTEDNPISYEQYAMRSGISTAANLREALKTALLPQDDYHSVLAMIDSPVLMVPADIYSEEESSKMYCHSFPSHSTDIVLRNVLPDLNAVAVFGINKDLKLVLEDHYPTVKFTSVASPVWSHLHQRSYTGIHNKLYGYFHDKKLEIISFSKKRFKFCNTFETSNVYDSVYFLLNTWNHLMMQTAQDELHLVGDIPEQETITEELKKYLKKVYIINPSADFNEAPATQIKNMPYDLMTLYVKGR